MTLFLPHAIENDTPADAVEVEQNYNVIEDYVNANLIHRDGSVAMTAPLHLFGNPLADNDAVPKSYVDVVMPIGVILPYGGDGAPEGWLLCDGTAYANATYPKLQNILGNRYNKPGTAAGSFCVPDMRGRVGVGKDAANTHYATTGRAGGSSKVPVPEHKHGIDHDHGAFTSSVESANHTHAIDHNHASVHTSEAADHTHPISYLADADTAGTGTAARVATYVSTGLHTTTGGAGGHDHTLDMPAFAGTSGIDTASHTHFVNVPNYDGDSQSFKLEVTDSLSQKSTTDFFAPYVTINYIVKAA